MAENNPQIFRKKSLESISSPEQLNDYLKVTNVGMANKNERSKQ